MKDSSQPDIIMEQKVFTVDVKKKGFFEFAVSQKGKSNMSS